jgi:hypothetical protein
MEEDACKDRLGNGDLDIPHREHHVGAKQRAARFGRFGGGAAQSGWPYLGSRRSRPPSVSADWQWPALPWASPPVRFAVSRFNTQSPITTTRQLPPLSQRGHMRGSPLRTANFRRVSATDNSTSGRGEEKRTFGRARTSMVQSALTDCYTSAA